MVAPASAGEVLGGLALAGLVVREVFSYLGKRKETKESDGTENSRYRELKIRSIINEQLQAFFSERDIHIRDIVREEISKLKSQ